MQLLGDVSNGTLMEASDGRLDADDDAWAVSSPSDSLST